MREVGILELKANLSALVGQVERGEELAITRRGKIVARLSGPPRSRGSRVDIADEFSRLQQDIESRFGIDADFDVRAAIDEGRA